VKSRWPLGSAEDKIEGHPILGGKHEAHLADCSYVRVCRQRPFGAKAQATEKKLAGAALTSFMTKCETDAKATCETSAQERKLVGAAKASFTKKCAEDAVGN
jgi:hypothetical protein